MGAASNSVPRPSCSVVRAKRKANDAKIINLVLRQLDEKNVSTSPSPLRAPPGITNKAAPAAPSTAQAACSSSALDDGPASSRPEVAPPSPLPVRARDQVGRSCKAAPPTPSNAPEPLPAPQDEEKSEEKCTLEERQERRLRRIREELRKAIDEEPKRGSTSLSFLRVTKNLIKAQLRNSIERREEREAGSGKSGSSCASSQGKNEGGAIDWSNSSRRREGHDRAGSEISLREN